MLHSFSSNLQGSLQRPRTSSPFVSRRRVAVGLGVLCGRLFFRCGRRCARLCSPRCVCVSRGAAATTAGRSLLPLLLSLRMIFVFDSASLKSVLWTVVRFHTISTGSSTFSTYVDMYNATSNTWLNFRVGLGQARHSLAAAALPSGLVFFAGGFSSGAADVVHGFAVLVACVCRAALLRRLLGNLCCCCCCCRRRRCCCSSFCCFTV